MAWPARPDVASLVERRAARRRRSAAGRRRGRARSPSPSPGARPGAACSSRGTSSRPSSSSRNSQVPALDVADRAGRASSAASPSRSRRAGVDGRRRRLLEDLLVAPLDRAVALAEMDRRRRGRRTGPGSRRGAAPSTRRSRISRSSPKAAARLAPGRGERVGRAPRGRGRAHALAAAAGRGLDEEREADPRGRGDQRVVGLVGVVVAGERPGRRVDAPAAGPRPCRPSPGSPRAAGRPSGSRPRSTASAKSAFSARNPKPGWTRVGAGGRAAATTAAMSSRSSASGPSVSRARPRGCRAGRTSA